MKRSELKNLTVRSLSKSIESRKISPVEVTEAYLDSIGAIDPKLNSYVTVTKDEALLSAHKAEKEIDAGDYKGPLHGVPIAVKDIFATKGIRTTNCSKIFWNYVPDFDATVIERLKNAGGVLLGKLYLHEFALIANVDFVGICRNPWNTDHATGGSSSGSGAAVSSSLCAASLGTDTGGSIRVPASYCGVVGLKPSIGRVSRYGVTPLSWTLDTVGPITKTVEDAAIMLQIISGRDPRDPASSDAEVPDYLEALGGDIKGVKIGVPNNYFFEDIDEEVERSIRKEVHVFETLGGQIVEVTIPWMKYTRAISRTIMIGEAAYLHERTLKQRYQDYGPVGERFAAGLMIPAFRYIKALKARDFLRRKMAELFSGLDVLITPATEFPAPLITDYFSPAYSKKMGKMTSAFNILGCPALSMPCGFNSS
ncbi:MAG: amidase, partial [Nitrososphaerales archaeon]